MTLFEYPLKTEYKNSIGRFLYVVVMQKFGSCKKFADSLDVSKQFIYHMINGEVPVRFAGYLARKYDFHPALLRYEDYIRLGGRESYETLLKTCGFITRAERDYVLEGKRVTDIKSFLVKEDASIG